MSEDEAPAPPDIDALRKQRHAALVDRWASGDPKRALTDEESAEVAHLVPEIAGELKRAEEAPAEEPQKKWPYEKTYEHYATTLAISERTLKRWVGLGRENDDLPPLDDPGQLAKWWARNMVQKTPKNLLDLEAAADIGEDDDDFDDKEPEDEDEDDAQALGGVGFASELARLRIEARDAGRALKREQRRKPPRPAQLELKRRRYSDALKILREWERDSTKILQGQGDVVNVAEIERILREKQAAISQEVRAAKVRLYQALRKKFADGFKGIGIDPFSQTYDDVLDTVYRALRASGFTKGSAGASAGETFSEGGAS